MSITSEEFYRIKRKVSTDCNLTGDELKTNEHFKMFGRFSKYYTCPGTVASKVNYRKRVLENPSNLEVQTMKIMNRQVRQAESTNLSKKALNKSRVHCNCDHWNSQSDQKIAESLRISWLAGRAFRRSTRPLADLPLPRPTRPVCHAHPWRKDKAPHAGGRVDNGQTDLPAIGCPPDCQDV